MLFIAAERAVFRHFGQQAFQRDARAAGDAEGARDFALSGFALRRIQEIEDLLFAWKAAIGGSSRWLRFAGHRRASWFLYQTLAFASFLAEAGAGVAFFAAGVVAGFADFFGAEDEVLEALLDDFAGVALVAFGFGGCFSLLRLLATAIGNALGKERNGIVHRERRRIF